MKTSKLFTAFIASAILTLSAAASTSNTYDNAVAAAKDLYMAGLMKGTSDTFSEEALELNRPATRTEIAITITRLLGKEKKAIYHAISGSGETYTKESDTTLTFTFKRTEADETTYGHFAGVRRGYF